MGERTMQDLRQLQALPLSLKIRLTQDRIRQWVNEFGTDGVYISFSGGKDSTVLMHLVRDMYGDSIPGLFCDTGLEYPEIRNFIKTFRNVVWAKPKMTFKQVIKNYGYPVISKEIAHKMWDLHTAEKNGTESYVLKQFNEEFKTKNGKKNMIDISKWKFLIESPFPISHKCCDVMKKSTAKEYLKKTGRYGFTAQMACESMLRTNAWIKNGCNAFNAKNKISNPMSFWLESDVLQYIKQNNLKICSIYGDIVEEDQLPGQMTWNEYIGFDVGGCNLTTTGLKRTGCMFCMFGCHINNDDRFTRMKKTHPKQYDYIMRPWEQGGLNYKEVIDWINEHGNLNIKY